MAAIDAAIAQDRQERSQRAELGVLRQRYLDLTPREREVYWLLGQASCNKTIARALSISQHTVKVHVRNILGKLRVSNRAEVIRLCSSFPSSIKALTRL